jgi:xylulokinase
MEIVEALGIRADSVRASGGGARSPLWRQILADVFAKPVATLETQEGSAFGAALLAMVGTGEYADVPEVCQATIREVQRIEPRAAEAEVYRKAYATYRALYPALRPLFPAMG